MTYKCGIALIVVGVCLKIVINIISIDKCLFVGQKE